jgi:hypothetical protein
MGSDERQSRYAGNFPVKGVRIPSGEFEDIAIHAEVG